MNSFYLGDCIDILDNIDNESIDLVITDPPYNSNKKFKNDNLPEDKFIEFTETWFSLVIDKMKKTSSFYCFINEKYLWKFKEIFDKKLIFRRLIVWEFEGFYNKFKNNYDNRIEYILFYTKSNDYTFNIIKESPSRSFLKRWFNYAESNGNIPYEKLTPSMKKRQSKKVYEKNPINVTRGLYQGNIIKVKRPRFKEHPTQKPEILISIFINASSKLGDFILDPFSGIGTTCIVAKKLERKYIGIEIDELFYNKACENLKKTYKGEKVFNNLSKKEENNGIKRLDQFLGDKNVKEKDKNS